MMTSLLRGIAAAFWGVTLAATSATAEVVSLRFTGTTNAVDASLKPYFSVGDPFTYTLSYDTATIGTYAGDDSRSFTAISAVFSVEATGGSWSTLGPTIQIDDNPSYSRFNVEVGSGLSNPTANGKSAFNVQLGLYSDDINMITGLALPSDVTLAGWSTSPSSSGVFTYWENGTGPYFMRFSFTSVEKISAVPEPSTSALLLGLCALGRLAGKRQRRRPTPFG